MLKKSSSGFTLIEVLVAIIVLAMGLLGFAALQAVTLRNSQSAYNRSVATQLAYDIADRMRANNVTAAPQYLSSTMAANAATAQATCTTTAGCTSNQMAENDLFEWNRGVQLLPMGQSTIAVVGGVYSVTINWDDNGDGLVDPNNDPNFIMSFSL